MADLYLYCGILIFATFHFFFKATNMKEDSRLK